jgi:wyosine [tRNA(Phe)-imidazoG37] synthetase (radical SAM superfamily)
MGADLDINLGAEIDLLKHSRKDIAVITNASLLWMDDVKEDLMKADWVSVSIDAADEDVWRRIDRPHGALRHIDILNGIIEFSKNIGVRWLPRQCLWRGLTITIHALGRSQISYL